MTATLSKALDTNVEVYPAQVLGRGYSNAELKLIKDVWAQTKVVAKEAMQLCLNLYDLKTEMDANDPDAGNNPTKGRFWTAFEQGDLPDYVTNSRKRAEEWLSAGAYARHPSLPGASGESLLNLSPSTVCKVSKISHPAAKKICTDHLKQHEFIGFDAANWLSRQDHDDDVLE